MNWKTGFFIMTFFAAASLWKWNGALDDLDAADAVIVVAELQLRQAEATIRDLEEANRLLCENIQFVTIPMLEQESNELLLQIDSP